MENILKKYVDEFNRFGVLADVQILFASVIKVFKKEHIYENKPNAALTDAQAARGAEFENCSVWKKTKNVCSLLMPLFFSTVRRSTDLAMAMEARGYQEGAETTRMYPLEYTAADKKATTFMWVFCVGIGVLMLITGILF